MTVEGGNAFGVLIENEPSESGTSSQEGLDALLGDGIDQPKGPEVTPGQRVETAPAEPASSEAPATPEAGSTTTKERIETAPPGDPDPNDPDAQASGDGTQPGTEEGLIWGRYKSLTDAHEGYKNMQRREERTAAQAAALEQELQRRDQILQNILQKVQEGQVPVDPAQQQLDPLQIIQDRAREAAKAEMEERQQAQTQQERFSKVLGTVNEFRSKYQDAAEGSEVDLLMGEIVNEFQKDPEGEVDPELFPMDNIENLEIAYVLAKNPPLYRTMLDLDLVPSEENLRIAHEAALNPSLKTVLQATGVLQQDDPDGQLLEWARQMAGIPSQVQAVQVQAAQPNPEAMRRAAFVETGGTGAPTSGAPGTKPNDPIMEAIAAYRGNGSQDENVFGV